jgi:hypothetical protein
MKNWYKSLEGRYADLPADIQILNLVSDIKKAANLFLTQKKVRLTIFIELLY